MNDPGADSGDKIIPVKSTGSPHALHLASEDPESIHVEKDMKQISVQKHVCDELPDVKPGPRISGNQSEKFHKRVVTLPIGYHSAENDLLD
jgi:hypothetical protein